MALLANRVWRVVVGAALGNIRAGLAVDKHRCYFRVEKSIKPEPNKCALQIWNLSREQRAQIEQMRPKKDDKTGIPVLIEAGYKEAGAAQIFLGDLRTVFSERVGADWITTVESGDGEQAQQTARINQAFGPRTSPEVVLNAIVRTLGVGEGNVAKTLAKLRVSGVANLFEGRVAIKGRAADALTNFTRSAGLEWSIQDGALQILDRDKVLDGFAVRLGAGSGLIESPSVDPKGVLTCKMLLQPSIRVGALLVLESLTARGNYRIERAAWECDTHGRPWYVTVEAKRY
jgi:hypothetical protein